MIDNADATALLLGAIFPSLPLEMALDVASTTMSVAQAVQRAHHIACPSIEQFSSSGLLGVARAERVRDEYKQATSVSNPQIIDVCHRSEYDETVVACVVDVEPVDRAIACAVASRLLGNHGADRYPASALAVGRAASVSVDGSLLQPAPVWLASEAPIVLCKRRQFNEMQRRRVTAPLKAYGDVFQHGDHKCSVAKECQKIGVDTVAERWNSAAPHIVAGITAILETTQLMDPVKELAIELPWYGPCLLEHDGLKLAEFRVSAKDARLEVVQLDKAPNTASSSCREGSKKKQGTKKAESHEPDHESHHVSSSKQPVACENQETTPSAPGAASAVHNRMLVTLKRISLKTQPMIVRYTPVTTSAKTGFSGAKQKTLTETINVKVSDVSVTLIGDFLLSPTGRHVLQVDDAKIRIGTLKIRTSSTLKNMALWVARPIIKKVVERQLKKALIGRKQL